jgi:hypothetical protein
MGRAKPAKRDNRRVKGEADRLKIELYAQPNGQMIILIHK